MNQLYSRVFLQILDSSIAENFTLRHVFEDFLKLAEYRTGTVDMTRQALARRLNIPLDLLNEHITTLESPDVASRDQEHQGRRIARLDDHRDWGWVILNWHKYEEVRSRADAVMRVTRHREKKKLAKAAVNPVDQSSPLPTPEAAPEVVNPVDHPPNGEDSDHWVPPLPRKEKIPDGLALELKAGINPIFQRKSTDLWHPDDERLLVEVCRRPNLKAEWAELLAYHARAPRYFPRSVKTLLSDWQKHLDHARQPDRKDTHDTDRRIAEKRVDRSIGTANEGIAHEYAGWHQVWVPNPDGTGNWVNRRKTPVPNVAGPAA